MKTKLLLLAAVAALAVAAPAQGFRGGAMMRMFAGGSIGAARMLQRPDVQEELKLTDEQKGKLDAQSAASRDKFRAAFTDMRNAAGGGSPEDMQKTMQTKMMGIAEDVAKEALAVLDDAQRKRVKEIAIQSQGSLVAVQPDVAKELGITEAQKAKIDDLQRLQDEANAGLFEQVQNGDIDREQMQTTMQKNTATMKTEVEKVLTEAQRTKLKAMGGVPFDFKDPKPGAPGSFGRPPRA